MKPMKCLAVVTMLAMLAQPAAWADDWLPPAPRLFAAFSGDHGFKVIPQKKADTGWEEQATGILFAFNEDGSEKVLRESKLVNIPMSVLISDSGKRVVTVDTYGRLGYDHAIVVYGEKGEVLADYKLDDLLTKEEIEKNVQHSISSRHWTSAGTVATMRIEDGGPLTFKLSWGKAITINLNDGKLVK